IRRLPDGGARRSATGSLSGTAPSRTRRFRECFTCVLTLDAAELLDRSALLEHGIQASKQCEIPGEVPGIAGDPAGELTARLLDKCGVVSVPAYDLLSDRPWDL